MRRRAFALSAAGLAMLPGCTTPLGRWWARLVAPSPAQAGARPAIGTNLSGMEWAKPGLRHGASSLPNLHFTVPRKAEVAWLAGQGFGKNRLPIQWELLQPVLFDTRPDAQARALVGEPGAFHAGYAQFVTDVLDAHAAAGTTCILDLHNYCRYQDFRYQPDGRVLGLTAPTQPQQRPWTSDRAQVQERIFALAPGATLTIAHFVDVWTRIVRRWKGHPGVGGWGLMNEPHDLPRPGETVASEGGGEDLTIWPAFARAAVQAIRAIDRETPVYVAGNAWSAATAMATQNPGFPLAGEKLVYEVHMYLDAFSNGHAFDFQTEVAKNFSAGIGPRPIDLDTGVERLRPAVQWARGHGVPLALTEIGMPTDDPRWEEMYERAVAFAVRSGVEVFSWMGGNHWPIRNYPIHHTPGWHQHRTLEPAVAGPMKAAAGVARATLYDDGPGWAADGRPVTVTVYARGTLAAPLVLEVRAEGGGTFSKTVLRIPAGANGADSFDFTPPPDAVVTLHYTRRGGGQVPPPRKVYSLADPVAHADRHLADAAHALLARWRACKWEMAHGHTDYVQGRPCADGQPLRAVADSGWGSSLGNAMEMVNFVNNDSPQAGSMAVPRMRTVGNRKACDTSVPQTWGLWCKKVAPQPGVLPNPVNRVPYDLQDPHFAIAAIALPRTGHSGVVFQASRAEERQCSELALEDSVPQARWTDDAGRAHVLAAPAPLPAGRPAVLALACAPGEQLLRVDGRTVARADATLAPAVFAQMLIGWGFIDHHPRPSFGGLVYGVIAGKGRPSAAELAVLERYLASLATGA